MCGRIGPEVKGLNFGRACVSLILAFSGHSFNKHLRPCDLSHVNYSFPLPLDCGRMIQFLHYLFFSMFCLVGRLQTLLYFLPSGTTSRPGNMSHPTVAHFLPCGTLTEI